MPNSNNKDRKPLNINFAASHDQASVLPEMALKYKELDKIIPNLENLGYLPSNFKKLSPEELQRLSEELKKQYNELDETKKEIINTVTHAKQIVSDLQECAKKLSTIQLLTPDEKFKYAKSLVPELLTTNEKNRFKKIEEALNSTCVIKSAGDETIKFQLGTLGYAKDSDMITESEFKYLVVPRLKDNNLLDSYRLYVKGDMLLERTPLEICQAINEDFFSDDDYEASKELIKARIKGIDYELGLERLKNLENNDIDRDLTKLRQEFMSVSSQNDDSSEKDIPEKELSLPEVPTHSFELNSQQPSNEPTININPIEEDQKKSIFVSLLQELIPEKKKNLIYIDTIQPTSLETIMQASLEESSSLPENEIFKLNYQTASKIKDAGSLAVHKLEEQIRKSYSIDGSSTYEEMKRSCEAALKNHDEKLKKTLPCKLTDKSLVCKFYEYGKKYLEEKIKKCKTAIKTLEENKIKKWGEFSKYNLKYANLSDAERKKTLNIIYELKITTLNRELENAEKQLALWLGEKTFTQNVEKNGKIKQEKVPFPEKELNFRNLVLVFNSNSASEGKTINVYLDGVYLVSDKKAEPIFQISNNRAPHKSCITGQTSSSANFYKEHNTKEKNPKQTVGMALGS